MPKTQYTRALYESLVDFYRAHGPQYSQAAITTGCSQNIAKTAYERGWRGLVWAEPIIEVLDKEAVVVRAARQKIAEEQAIAEENVRLQARKDAVDARTQEAQGAKLSRGNALRLAMVSMRMLLSMEHVAVEVDRRIKAELSTIPMSELRKWMSQISGMVKDAQTTLQMALAIERVVTGEPIAILGIQIDRMSIPQMFEQLEDVERTMTRLKALPEPSELDEEMD